MNLKYMIPSLVLMSACGSSESLLDGGQANASLNLKLNTASSTALGFAAETFSAGTSVNITSARINVDEIKLKAPEGISCAEMSFVDQTGVSCETESSDSLASTNESSSDDSNSHESESEIKIKGPFVFDLITGESTPSLSEFKIPSGMFKEIQIKLKKAQVSDGILAVDDELIDNTLVAAGTFTDLSSVSHSFSLKLSFSEELKIEQTAGISVKEGLLNAITINMNVTNWFSGLDLQQCIADNDYSLDGDSFVIDEHHSGSGRCSDIENTVKENIKDAFEFENEEHEDSSETEKD